jgi:uncharacterized membrane protein YGL010W
MKTIDQWFAEYGVSHQHPTNKKVHWICVPLIFFSILGLLASIPLGGFSANFPLWFQPHAHLGSLLFLLALLFYIRLSPPLAFGLALFGIVCLLAIAEISQSDLSLWQICLFIFVAAWIGQFWGHKVEGAKPSFFQDLQFLLIGPAWLLGFVYKRWGINY